MRTSMILVFWSQDKKPIFIIKNEFNHIYFKNPNLIWGFMIVTKYTECLNIRFYFNLPQNQDIRGEVTRQEILDL